MHKDFLDKLVEHGNGQKQACEGIRFAPAVRVASDFAADFLHKVKGLLVNDSFMGILENRPFVLRDIMA